VINTADVDDGSDDVDVLANAVNVDFLLMIRLMLKRLVGGLVDAGVDDGFIT